MVGRRFLLFLTSLLLLTPTGCALFPEVMYQPRYHNPFPQLYRVAVLPFFNLSDEPTVDSIQVMTVYYNELQSIPGFEVMPPGVVIDKLRSYNIHLSENTDYQKLAEFLGVDAVLVGAVTEFDPYYPPRMGISVNWYAANPGFHPIPPGYGLPWGTPEEEYIPEDLVDAAEFALAREQLKTQTPEYDPTEFFAPPEDGTKQPPPGDDNAAPNTPKAVGEQLGKPSPDVAGVDPALPTEWPDPRGFIPEPPSPERPKLIRQSEPIIEHVRVYNGNDGQFTTALANFYEFQDDARFGGWQGYLQRSDDFIRFCCYMHITETLAARGGAGKTRVVNRWLMSRYIP